MHRDDDRSDGHDDGLFAGLFDDVVHTSRPQREFQPWHLPRKQYVRRRQWARLVRGLLPRLRVGGSERPYIKCLGLADQDLLDLRVISDPCLEKGVAIRFFGFDSAARPNSAVRDAVEQSMHRLITEGRLDDESMVEGAQFEEVGHKESVATRKLKSFGTADVVNLDFCDSVGRHAPGGERTSYSAIRSLLELQQAREEPWILFVTTRSDRSTIDPDAVKLFWDCLLENIQNDMGFRAAFGTSIGRPPEDLEAIFLDVERVEDDLFPEAYAVAFSKWLMHLGAKSGRPMKIAVKQADAYSVRGNGERDMFSIAYWVTPVSAPIEDPTGLAARRGDGEKVEGSVDTERLAETIAMKVGAPTDVGSQLADDETLLGELLAESRALLVEAGYVVDGYEEWVRGAAAGDVF